MLKAKLLMAAGAACASIIAVSYLPDLPSVGLLSLLTVMAAVAVPIVTDPWRWLPVVLLGGLLGALWATVAGHRLMDQLLPVSLEGELFQVTGVVVGLPRRDPLKQRFVLEVEQLTPLVDTADLSPHLPKRLLLNWYRAPAVLPGERWQLLVKLKRPRGFVNPGGFDYQAWLMRQGIGATGYVRHADGNQRLEPAVGALVDRWRYRLFAWIDGTLHQSPLQGLVAALVVGERQKIAPEQWALLQRTGTNHLIAISGLHVGLAALLGHGLGLMLGRLLNLVAPRVASAALAALCSGTVALAYAALAGFGLTTQRALMMVAAVQLALLMGRSWSALHGLLLAALLVLLLDPLAAHDLGFWLSFGAVFWLLFAFVGRIDGRVAGSRLGANAVLRWMAGLGYSQWVVFVGLLLPLLVLVKGISLLAPLANLVAIPLVSLILVPVLLLAAVIYLLCGYESAVEASDGWGLEFAHGLLWLADAVIARLWTWLQLIDQWGAAAEWYPAVPMTTAGVAIGLVGVGLLLLPRGVPGRWLGGLALVAVLFPARGTPPPLRLTLLDVGQGLAVVVETANHTLVYDTGPRFGERFNAGAGIVAPYLKMRGLRRIDALVVSHGDGDHAGGLEGLLASLPADRVYYGELRSGLESNIAGAMPSHDWLRCERGHQWQWDGLSFELWAYSEPAEPAGTATKRAANNQSCILTIALHDQQILLPGDIEQAVEHKMLADNRLPAEVSVVVAPHHGSGTSSSEAWVARLRPEYVLYSAGFNNRYGHPHSAVQARYRHYGSQPLSTADSGAIQLTWRQGEALDIVTWRERQKRYWFTDAAAQSLYR